MKTLILDYMEATAARLPEKTAFADESSSVTFSALVARAKAVASALCGFMGAVYAGCAYSLLNLRHPAARIRAMLETLDTPIVVTDRAHLSQLEALEAPVRILFIEDLQTTAPDEAALSRIRAGMIDADPLYVNFTSGSTGTPKGVVVCHRNVCDFIPCFTETFSIGEADVLAYQAPVDFDVSV